MTDLKRAQMRQYVFASLGELLVRNASKYLPRTGEANPHFLGHSPEPKFASQISST